MSRILMVTPVLKSQRGNSITAARLYNGLSKRGYEIDLLSQDEPGWQHKLDLLTRTHSYNLVHGLHALYFSSAANHPVVKKLPMLLTTTGTDINYDLDGPGKQETLDTLLMADRIVVFNHDLGRKLADADPRLEGRLAVVPQGVDLPDSPEVSRRQYGIPESYTVFIIPSGLRPVKNLDLAIDGLEMVHDRHPGLSLLIVGVEIDREYTDRIKSRLRELPWAVYIGEVPHHSIGGIMRIADVVINTSRAEGQPQAALEAMSLGKPCILTAVPGNLGIIQDGVHGCYINSARELSDAALRLIKNTGLRHDMGNAARHLVNEKYSLKKEIDAYAGLYESLIS